MGKAAIKGSFLGKSIFIALSLSLSICFALPSLADNALTLEKLEKWLFFATFPGESDEDRIKRLEERTFGEKAEGPLDARLSKLDEILTERQKEKEADDKSTGSGKSQDSTQNNPERNFGSSSNDASISSPDNNNNNSASNSSPPGSAGVPPASKSKSSKQANSSPKSNAKKIPQNSNQSPLTPSSASFPAPGSNYGSSPASGPPAAPQSATRPGQTPLDSARERERIAVQAAREQEMHDLLQEGARLWRNKQRQEAVEQFQQVLRLDPQNPDAHFSIGVYEEARGRLKEAKAHYQTALQTSPDNRDYQEAVAAISKRMASDPNRVLNDKATDAFKRGEYISAINYFKELDEKTPKQASVKYSLGTTYLMMKDYFNAIEYFKLAHQLEPNNDKYTKSFNDLSAEMSKHAQAQSQIEGQYQGSPGQAQGGTNLQAAPGMKPPGAVNSAFVPMQNTPQQMYPQQQQGYPQQMPQSFPNQMPMQPQRFPNQMPMQQAGYPSYPNQQAQYPGNFAAQQNPYGAPQNPYMNQNQGTYIPPDPAAFSRPQVQQSMQQTPAMQAPPPQFPAQMQTQYQAPPVQQRLPQNFAPAQNSQFGNAPQNQFAGQPQAQEYTPPPQSAPSGAFDPRLAQQLNNPGSGGKVDPMSNYGLSGRSSEEGVLLTGVRGGSRASKAGLKKGDIIRTVDGNEVMQPAQLNQVLSQYDGGQTLPLLIFREGNITPIQF
ncbi:MAG: tetratricopeptide repeat protein [Candidatus Obscuribacterales bacterium]|nr:tetratricopeptide repeat protein [Candidatus Obscuribacterales bacterium]